MKDKDSKYLLIRNQVMTVLWAVMTFLCLWVGIKHIININVIVSDNKFRVMLNVHKDQVEHGEYEPYGYPYLVVDLEGNILYRDEEFTEYTKESAQVQELLTVDEAFLKTHPGKTKEFFVLKKDGKITGFVVYMVPDKEISGSLHQRVMTAVIPLFLAIAGAAAMLLFQIWYTNHRILKPIQNITVSTSQMIQGNYEVKADRVYETKVDKNEVGKLTSSFEAMRDELRIRMIKEEELKRSQQEMISCISHDLKTPISTIMAYAEAMRDGIASSKEEEKEYLKIMVDKTHLLTNMIQELLEVSNAQLNQLDIVKKEVYLQEYLTPVIKELEGFVRSHGMELKSEITAANPVILMDENRITQVLYNLVENSIKYSKDKELENCNCEGEKKEWIRIYASWEEAHVLIRVQDDGIGVNADDIPYVFDKFYRGEKSRNLSIPGSGLGLSICKYIIEAHQGEIYCRNRKEGGCEFGFTLPG